VTGGGVVIWLTGPPASGKSTLGQAIARRLRDAGVPVLALDGDEVRGALVPPHGYDDAGRDAFYHSLGNLAVLAASQGLAVVVAATAHRRRWRDRARAAAPRFVEVHVDTPVDECRRRDPKGLYARADPTSTLPGAAIAYEAPRAPDVVARPDGADAAVAAVVALV
jgi:adenylylsulfate kinase